jgi:hypothetical protein
MLMADFYECSKWMTGFSVTHMLWDCVTLGFCNSVYRIFAEELKLQFEKYRIF